MIIVVYFTPPRCKRKLRPNRKYGLEYISTHALNGKIRTPMKPDMNKLKYIWSSLEPFGLDQVEKEYRSWSHSCHGCYLLDVLLSHVFMDLAERKRVQPEGGLT